MSIRFVQSVRRWVGIALINGVILLVLNIACLWGNLDIGLGRWEVHLSDGRLRLLQQASEAGEMGGPAPELDCRTTAIGFFFLLPLLMLGYLVARRLIEVKSNETGRCLECNYNLINNTSGICPECGTAVGVQKGEA